MNKAGICSITFRDLSCEELIEQAKRAKLDAIEWGSDVHVLPNNLKRTKEVARLTRQAGLEVSSYGSYYKVGVENEYSFEEILETSIVLGAKDVRVWAGKMGSKKATQNYFDAVVLDSKRIADLARVSGVRVSYEYHNKTLTDTVESALKLLKAVDNNNIKIYWQPSLGLDFETRLTNIKALGDYITNVHVFNWKEIDRLPLKKGRSDWIKYVESINQYSNSNKYYLLEFVKDNNLNQFYEDAKALIEILNNQT